MHRGNDINSTKRLWQPPPYCLSIIFINSGSGKPKDNRHAGTGNANTSQVLDNIIWLEACIVQPKQKAFSCTIVATTRTNQPERNSRSFTLYPFSYSTLGNPNITTRISCFIITYPLAFYALFRSITNIS